VAFDRQPAGSKATARPWEWNAPSWHRSSIFLRSTVRVVFMRVNSVLALDYQHMSADRSDLLHGTLDFIVLKTLHAMGPLHGYAIARRIERLPALASRVTVPSLA
jgi:hypothetical protein